MNKSPLTRTDLLNLADSFITAELAEQAEFFRVNDLVGSELIGAKRNGGADYSGVVMPYFVPEQSNPREYRLRRDVADRERKADGTYKDIKKYLSPPGRAGMFYFPPNCQKAWLSDISIPIVITEGEKKALALHRVARYGLTDAAIAPKFLVIGLGGVWNFRGIVERTNGADGGRQDVKGLIPDFHLIDWKSRKVTILYDANVSTNKDVYFARLKLAKELTELGAAVFLADCPNAEKCNGIDDVLGKTEREQNIDTAVKQCHKILDAAQPFKAEKVSQANQILCLAEDIELFHTSDGEPFASIEVGGHIENHRVKSKNFRDYLSYQYYQTDGKSPSSQALQDAINSLSGKAKFEGETQDVFIRLAAFNEKIYLDLCNDNWQIVEIDAGGWRVIEATDAPVRFRRAKAMLALPTPATGGDISKLKNFLNVDKKNLTLILAWLVNCFRPDYPFPILLISGEQGTAKSTTSKLLKELVDPSVMPFRSAPRDEHNLVIAANNSWIVGLDNLSVVPDWLSDALCRLSTGGGFGTRTLYENDEETIFTAKRPIILNGIGDIASRSDLLDRALLIKLEAIPKNKRKTEREFWAEFEKEKTSIFSALVSAVSSALKNIENIRLPELPRMADFALWATAAEQGLELEENAFLKAYTQNRKDAHSIVLEDSIFAEVLQELLRKKANGGKYKEDDILLKDFLDRLKEAADAGDKERSKDKKFPKSSKGLRNQIERINPNLREIGIFITFHGRTGANADKGASLSLEYNCNQTSVTSVTSVSPQNKAQTADVTTDVTQNAQTSNVSNVSNVSSNVSNVSSNVSNVNSNKSNSLASKVDVTDVTDVTLQPYSNGNGKAEYVDIEI
jgi:hypothetical protein